MTDIILSTQNGEPVAVADSLRALAKLRGVTPAAISHSVHKFGDRGKYRRVEI